MKLSKAQLGILALVATNIIWGAAFPIYKWSLENLEPFTFVFLRFFLAALLILPFATKKLQIAKEDYLWILAVSLCGVSLTVTLWFLGLPLAPTINSSVIEATGPIFLLIFSFFFLHERLKTKTVIGTVISLIGVVFIMLQPLLENGDQGSILGNIFFLLATISGVTHSLLVKRLLDKYSAITLTFWTFLIGSMAILPMALYETYQYGFLEGLNYKGIIGLSYATLLASFTAYFLFAFGLKQIKANETGVYAYLCSLVTILVAVPLLGEQITSTYLVGAALVFIGISVAEGVVYHHPQHHVKK